MKKYVAAFVLGALLLSPGSAFAKCTAQGYTVAFINGILTTREQAQADAKALAQNYFQRVPSDPKSPVTFTLVYNPTHLAGAGDLAESISQIFGAPVSDFDFKTMLQQLYTELATRRVLMVGHSQGTLYSNAFYTYLLAHGEPKEAVGVYNVATPASFVAGGGMYLNSNQDLALSMIAVAAKKAGAPLPLPGNIDIGFTTKDLTEDVVQGHSFVNAYLEGAGDRVVSDVQKSVSALRPTFASETGDCFDAPPRSLGQSIEAAVFWVADPTASVVASATTDTVKACVPQS